MDMPSNGGIILCTFASISFLVAFAMIAVWVGSPSLSSSSGRQQRLGSDEMQI